MQLGSDRTAQAASAPSTTEFVLQNEEGEKYLIQISWPLAWEADPTNKPSVPILYVT
jgi:hypothetical protein